MQPTDPNLLVVKQHPLVLWLVSVSLAIPGVILLFSPGLRIPALICLGAGLGVLLLGLGRYPHPRPKPQPLQPAAPLSLARHAQGIPPGRAGCFRA